jgi:DNA-binding helix-hairpin-helix protein with protein kinase domain
MTTLRTTGGRSLVKGAELAAGGEGRVYELSGSPAEVIKMYHAPASPAQAAKLRAIVEMRTAELSAVSAWPTDLAVSPAGAVIGIVMPKIDSKGVIDRLSHPGERRQHFANADYLFITTVAGNLMTAASVLHSRGVVIGDVNESNVMVRPNGTVAFIDVDSFQITRGGVVHRCTVAKDLFLPPELIGQSLANANRSPAQDCFGLAVLAFQLLMNGRHPFHGRILDGMDRSTQDLVSAGAYAYSPRSRLPMAPPPGAMAVMDLEPLAPLFEQAFLSQARPTAADWAAAIGKFKAGLRPCQANSRHAIFAGKSTCVLCGLPRDPLPAPVGGGSGAWPNVGSIRQLLSDIAGMADPKPFATAEPEVAANEREFPTRTGEPSPSEVRSSEGATFPTFTLVSSLLCGLVSIAGAAMGGSCGWTVLVGIVSAVLGFTSASQVARWNESWNARRYVKTYAARRAAIANELAELEIAESSAMDFLQRRQSLVPRIRQMRDEANRIAEEDRRAYEAIQNQALSKFRIRWIEDQMDAFLIGPAVIQGIGTERKRVLASHGIETAADVNAQDLAQVPGFGPVLTATLIDWRNDCQRVVSQRSLPPMPPSFTDSLRREHTLQLTKSAERLRVEFSALQQDLAMSEAAAKSYSSAVSSARANFRRARSRALTIDASA